MSIFNLFKTVYSRCKEEINMKKRFDAAMMYIDANIQDDPKLIKQGIVQVTGYPFNKFDNFFRGLTEITLAHYIALRKMYYASLELRYQKDKSIVDIALDFGYSEQSSFTRAFTAYTNLTPNDVRKGVDFVSDNKIRLSNFIGTSNKRIQRIMEQLDETGDISGFNAEYLVSIEEAANEFGFSLELCYQIADIADQLDLPAYSLIEMCFDKCIEEHELNDFPYKERCAVELGIYSDKELDDICRYYQCKYYDLDAIMVIAYRENHK